MTGGERSSPTSAGARVSIRLRPGVHAVQRQNPPAAYPPEPVSAQDRLGYSPQIEAGRLDVDDVIRPIDEEAGKVVGEVADDQPQAKLMPGRLRSGPHPRLSSAPLLAGDCRRPRPICCDAAKSAGMAEDDSKQAFAVLWIRSATGCWPIPAAR